MTPSEQRYRVVSTLLQAGEPRSLGQLESDGEVTGSDLVTVLRGLADEGLVVEGDLVADQPGPQYCWGARWGEAARQQATSAKQRLRAAIDAAGGDQSNPRDLEGEAAEAFHDFVIHEYQPPPGKKYLVFFQCSVRRPFSTSPSQASMRRAVSLATGYDPAKDFDQCPVHVVVLASTIGPAPYEFEDVHPANVGGGGVKQFSAEHYDHAKPILALRMAQYMNIHGSSYERTAAFTHGRYAEVMQTAQLICGADFPIFPAAAGPCVVSMDGSQPRTYWSKYWIQLYLEIVSWLGPAARKQARARLKKLKVKYQ